MGGVIPAVINHDIPRSTGKRVELSVPVSDQFLDLWKEMRVGATAVEKSDLVTAIQSPLNHVRSDESRSTEYKNA